MNDVMTARSCPPPNAVVELCRDMLEQAERGELTGIAVVAECEDGDSVTARAGGDTYRLVGLAALLQRSMLECDEAGGE